MHSPTSLEGSRLVRIVVPCAQMRVSWPSGHKDAFSSKQRKAPCVLRDMREVMSVLCRSVVVDSMRDNIAITW